MINNLNPDEKNHWDKKMSSYQLQLENRSARGCRPIALVLITAFILLAIFAISYNVLWKMRPDYFIEQADIKEGNTK